MSPILSNYRIISTNKSRRLITRLHRCDKTGGGNAFDFASLIDRFRFPPAVTNFPGHSRQLLVTYERIRNGTASAFIDWYTHTYTLYTQRCRSHYIETFKFVFSRFIRLLVVQINIFSLYLSYRSNGKIEIVVIFFIEPTL